MRIGDPEDVVAQPLGKLGRRDDLRRRHIWRETDAKPDGRRHGWFTAYGLAPGEAQRRPPLRGSSGGSETRVGVGFSASLLVWTALNDGPKGRSVPGGGARRPPLRGSLASVRGHC